MFHNRAALYSDQTLTGKINESQNGTHHPVKMPLARTLFNARENFVHSFKMKKIADTAGFQIHPQSDVLDHFLSYITSLLSPSIRPLTLGPYSSNHIHCSSISLRRDNQSPVHRSGCNLQGQQREHWGMHQVLLLKKQNKSTGKKEGTRNHKVLSFKLSISRIILCSVQILFFSLIQEPKGTVIPCTDVQYIM